MAFTLNNFFFMNLVEYSGERQIAVDCRRLRQSRGRSLVIKLVEIGRRM